MFLFPLHLTHKNGLSEQFDVLKIFGAFIMIFFNLSPLLRHRKLRFFFFKKMNQTASPKVSIDGSDTKLEKLCICKNDIFPCCSCRALRARERSVSQADGNNRQGVVIESSDI